MTPNNTQIGSNWRDFSLKLAFELAVIIVGILIALAINEWQTERENREFEARLRAALSRAEGLGLRRILAGF